MARDALRVCAVRLSCSMCERKKQMFAGVLLYWGWRVDITADHSDHSDTLVCSTQKKLNNKPSFFPVILLNSPPGNKRKKDSDLLTKLFDGDWQWETVIVYVVKVIPDPRPKYDHDEDHHFRLFVMNELLKQSLERKLVQNAKSWQQTLRQSTSSDECMIEVRPEGTAVLTQYTLAGEICMLRVKQLSHPLRSTETKMTGHRLRQWTATSRVCKG